MAEKALERSGKLAANVVDALRTPLLRWDQEVTRDTKTKHIVERRGVSVPAWAVVAGGLIWLATIQPGSSRPSGTWAGLLGLHGLVPFAPWL